MHNSQIHKTDCYDWFSGVPWAVPGGGGQHGVGLVRRVIGVCSWQLCYILTWIWLLYWPVMEIYPNLWVGWINALLSVEADEMIFLWVHFRTAIPHWFPSLSDIPQKRDSPAKKSGWKWKYFWSAWSLKALSLNTFKEFNKRTSAKVHSLALMLKLTMNGWRRRSEL